MAPLAKEPQARRGARVPKDLQADRQAKTVIPGQPDQLEAGAQLEVKAAKVCKELQG